jgi:hypothetical protein
VGAKWGSSAIPDEQLFQPASASFVAFVTSHPILPIFEHGLH